MAALISSVLVVGGEGAPLQGRDLPKALPDVDFTFVSSGEAALAEIKTRPPDIVVIDADLPNRDGYEVIRAVGGFTEPSNIDVVFLSHDVSSTLQSRVKAIIAVRSVRQSFNAAYAEVLKDAFRAAADLTHSELEALRAVDFPVDAEVEPAPAAERAARYDALMRSSLTTQQAAKRLKVNESRIRQRLLAAPRQLYGIRDRNVWRLPAFQFGRSGLVPNIEQVIARLDPALDPVAVHTWFHTPNLDLAEGTPQALSPLQWLGQGRRPDIVADLAEDL